MPEMIDRLLLISISLFMAEVSDRRKFLKSFFTFLTTGLFWPKTAFSQIIPFVYWRRPQNNLWVWGVNTLGELGTGNVTSYSSPVQVAGSWDQVNSAWSMDSNAPNLAFSLGVRNDGTLWAWGNNTNGELAQGTHAGKFSSPVQIAGSWNQVSCGGQGWGYMFGLGIKSDRSLWAWGNGLEGNLGQSNALSYSSPVQVLAGTSWTSVHGGFNNWLGIQTDGTLWACGTQGAGELGVGTATTSYNSPVQVGGSWIQAMIMCDNSAGGVAGGIKSNGTLWMWGGNGAGDLGTGNLTAHSSPVQIGSASWTQLFISSGSLNSSHALAIQTNGSLWAWGGNSTGQLGQGDLVNRSSPVQIPGQWRSAFGLQTGIGCASLGIRSDGTLWAWGDNSTGLFGTGNTLSFSSPVQVGSSNWAFIGGGQNSLQALK